MPAQLLAGGPVAEAVLEERYEEAAVLRDRIRELAI